MIRLGFIGVGGYGRWQLESFLPFQHDGRLRICALADPSEGALSAASCLAGLEQATRFTDYEAMLDAGDLDAVVISSPIPTHEEMALAASSRGLFVLLEKPPVPLLSQLERLIAADKRGRVMVGFQHIYSPLLREMKRAVWSGEIGQPLSISGSGLWPRATKYYERASWAGKLFWNQRATLDGPCTNGMSHFVNSLFFVAGTGATGFALPRYLEGEAYRAHPLASYDLGVMRGETDGGLVFNALFSHAAAETVPVRFVVQGTEGKIKLGDNNKLLEDSRGRITTGSDGRRELPLAFLDFVEGQAKKNLTGLEAARAYVLATNMMFLSSGGIHDVAKRHAVARSPGTAEAIHEVQGLQELVGHASEDGAPRATTGMPWAVQPRRIERGEFNEQQMLSLLRSR